MPQLQNLVLTDRTPVTPVDHTFIPREIANGVGTVVESTGVPVGNSSVSVSLRKTPSGKFKGTLRLATPVVQTETISGVSRPVVVRTAYAAVEFTFDETSTEQERTDLIGMLASSLGTSKTLVNDTMVKLQGVY